MMSNLVEFVSNYDSESEEEGTERNSRNRKKIRRQIWIKSKEFCNAELAENYVNSLKTWKKITSYQTSEGYKISYRCTEGKYRNNECPAGIYLLYHSESFVVSLYESKNKHSNHTDQNRGLSMATREIVRQLFEDGTRKPNAIIAALRNRGLEEPGKVKLKNFLKQLRQQKFGPPTISVKDVMNWCNARMNVPVEEDTPFVLGFKVESDDREQNDLKIVISTRRLLQLVNKSEGVQTDATYKLIWQGYPVLIVGSSDMNRVFHPFAIAVCNSETELDFAFIFNCVKDSCLQLYGTEWNPKVLLADASTAITNAFKTVFGLPFRRLMCYFHVVKNIDGKLRGIKEKDEIRNDIDCLHLCPDDDTFTVVSDLFLKKWMEKNDSTITQFMEYFKSVWLTSFRYWYIGARNNFPITNNGLESTNSVIKKEHTFRERLPVGQFLEVLENGIVKKWSCERDPHNPNCKQFFMKPQLTTKVWTEAYQWSKLQVKILEEKKDDQSLFYMASSKLQQDITAEMVQSKGNVHLKWTSFDHYKTGYDNSVWKVSVTYSNYDFVSLCSCPVFAKKYICKHSLGMLIRLGKEKVPNEAKSLPLGQKRKRGRPTRAKKALLVQ